MSLALFSACVCSVPLPLLLSILLPPGLRRHKSTFCSFSSPDRKPALSEIAPCDTRLIVSTVHFCVAFIFHLRILVLFYTRRPIRRIFASASMEHVMMLFLALFSPRRLSPLTDSQEAVRHLLLVIRPFSQGPISVFFASGSSIFQLETKTSLRPISFMVSFWRFRRYSPFGTLSLFPTTLCSVTSRLSRADGRERQDPAHLAPLRFSALRFAHFFMPPR